ncbi:P-loop NTPase family protein [Actinoplanes sp. RD1]|uniref:hypothetical protein n=1 Tax=Actinoplanes sp. RD1 TaxID=3064538 RepID=UPI00274071AB|nr:hypothetical protein [Actinoplanes sp. RD1]
MPALPLYGLDRNPFAPQIPLDLLGSPSDEGLLAWIDGWKSLEGVHTYITERAAAKEPALVLVSGESHTGRTSVANYLTHFWAKTREWEADRTVVATDVIGHNYDAAATMSRWAGRLVPLITRAAGTNPLTGGTVDLLRALRQSGGKTGADFREALEATVVDLTDKKRSLAGILEGITSREPIDMVLESCFMVDTIFVMVVDRTRAAAEMLSGIDPVLRLNRAVRVDLDKIDHRDVCELVRKRWDRFHPRLESPFAAEDLARAFQDTPRTVTHVLKLVADMVDAKHANYPEDGTGWPDNASLSITEAFMRRRIESVESNLL